LPDVSLSSIANCVSESDIAFIRFVEVFPIQTQPAEQAGLNDTSNNVEFKSQVQDWNSAFAPAERDVYSNDHTPCLRSVRSGTRQRNNFPG